MRNIYTCTIVQINFLIGLVKNVIYAKTTNKNTLMNFKL